MPRAIQRDPVYRGRRFPAEVIERCVRWYITYRLSYRDLAAMMAEGGVAVTHTTIMRWVLRYVPEYERRWARFARPVGSSWRMDETAVSVRGGVHYLYRAVDKQGRSVDSLLCRERTMEAAQAFLRKAIARPGARWPSTLNLDGYTASHRAVRLLGHLKQLWDRALSPEPVPVGRVSNILPSTHQNSRTYKSLTLQASGDKPRRYPRKVFSGGGLYMYLTSCGGKHWRYKYRYKGKEKVLSLGSYPEVPLEGAKARHLLARQLLAAGLDPAGRKNQIRSCPTMSRESMSI